MITLCFVALLTEVIGVLLLTSPPIGTAERETICILTCRYIFIIAVKDELPAQLPAAL